MQYVISIQHTLARAWTLKNRVGITELFFDTVNSNLNTRYCASIQVKIEVYKLLIV